MKMSESLKKFGKTAGGARLVILAGLLVLLSRMAAPDAQAQFFHLTNWKTNEAAQIIATNNTDGLARVVVFNAAGRTLETIAPTPNNVALFMSSGYIADGSDLALPNLDYEPFSVTVPTAPNPYTHTFRIINDNTVEFNEDVLVILRDGPTLLDIATVTIEHDDPPGGAVDLLFMQDPPYDDTNPNPGANSFVYAVADGFLNRTFTINPGNVNPAADTLGITSHGLQNGDDVVFLQSTNLPGGVIPDQRYFVTNTTVNSFQLIDAQGQFLDFQNAGGGASTLAAAVRRVYIGGDFTSVNGSTNQVRISRLDTEGRVDFSFDTGTGADAFVAAIGVETNGNVVIGGAFSSVNGFARPGIARLLSTGAVDTSFNPSVGARSGEAVGTVRALALYRSGFNFGKVVIGGDFTSYNGTNRAGIARLNADGSLDTTFDVGAGANGPVYSVQIQTDGKVVIGGDFTEVNGVPRNRIARLNVNGSLDTSFNPGAGADDTVYAVRLDRSLPSTTFSAQSSGGPAEDARVLDTQRTSGVLIINYDFLTVPDTINVYFPPRTNAASQLIFTTGLTNGVASVAVPFGPSGTNTLIEIVVNEGSGQPGTLWFYDAIVIGQGQAEKVLIGGAFQNVDLRSRSRIARLNGDGSLDTSFNPGLGFDDTVFSIDVDPIVQRPVIAGLFTSYNSTARTNLARLLLDGALDTSFMDTAYNQRAGPTNDNFFVRSFISAVAAQRNGDVLIGGGFTHVGGDHGRLGVGTDVGGRLFVGTTNGATWPRREISPTELITTPISPRQREISGTGGTRWGIRSRQNVARVRGGVSQAVLSGSVSTSGGPGNMEFVSSTYNEDENGTNAVITVRRVNGRLGTTSIEWATSNLTAAAGTDYTATLAVSTWLSRYNFENILMFSSADLTNKNFRIPILEDALVEGNEDLVIQALNPVGSQLLPDTNAFPGFFARTPTNVLIGAAIGGLGQTRLTITDNDFNFGVFNFATTNYTVNEGAGSASITVIRTNGSVGAVSIKYATVTGGSATPGADYTVVTNTLTFAPGQTVRTFSVPIVNDTSVEFDETIRLILFEPTGGATLGSVSNAVLTILDNDNGSGSLAFTTNRFFVSETGAVAVVSVQRTSGTTGTVTVNLSTSDGTAVDGVHYAGVNTNLTFGNGVTLQTVSILIADDGAVNADRTINLALSGPGGGAQLGGTSNAVLTVVNDDAFGDLSFASTSYFVGEKDTNALITVVRRNGTAGTVTVDFATVPGGTATANGDYTNVTGTLTFTNGQTTATFLIPITDDAGLESEETVFLNLFNPVNGGLGSPSSAVLTIIDDEALNFPAGSDDTFFEPVNGPDNFVYAVAVQADRKLVVGGAFQFFNGSSRSRIARVNSSGSLDGAFNPGAGANDIVRSVIVQPDGRILIGGNFTAYNGTNRNYVARLNTDGSIDGTFNPGPGADNPVLSMALHTNGLVVIGGEFTFAGGLPRNRIAVLNTNGALNTAFNPGTGANGTVRAVAIHTNGAHTGKVVVGGDFSLLNGVANNRIARLDLANGSVDTTFAANVAAGISSGAVHAIAIHPDGPNAGRIVIGGVFTSVNGVARTNIARLNEDGTVDTSFAPAGLGPDGAVFTVAIDDEGRVLVGGEFTAVGGLGRSRFARLKGDGTLDNTINTGSGANSFVAAVATKPDKKIAIGGGFTQWNGRPRNFLVQIIGGATPGAGTLQFSAASYSANENDASATLTVNRQGGQEEAVSVDYLLVGGSAVAGQDFTNFASGTLFLTNGQASATISVPLVDDKLLDGNKTLQIRLANPTNLTAIGGPVAAPGILTNASGPTNATVTLVDNDSVLTFSASSYSVSEGGGAASITVVRSGGAAGPVSVRFFTVDGTATAGLDYTGVSNTLSFASGETTKTFAVPVLEDALVEGNETVTIVLTNAVGETSIGQSSVALTIVDNDFRAGTISFAAATYAVDENAGKAAIALLRTNGTSGTVTVQFQTAQATATAGADYVATNGIVVFADGETAKFFEVQILPDMLDTETNETVNLSITAPTGGATLGSQNTASLTIINNNQFKFGSFRFSTNAFSAGEGVGSAVVTVQRVGGTTGQVSVVFYTVDGTATAGQDYTGVTNTLVFADGQTTTNVSIPILNETPLLAEGPETILLNLTNVQGGASLANPSAATLTIVDDDFLPGSFIFLTNSFTANETTTNAVITVLRTNGSTGTVTVEFQATDGTARNGVDYNSTNGVLTFADGVTSNAFLVPLIHNPLQRGNFSVALTLNNPSGGANVSQSSALLTIIDNEPPAGDTDTSFTTLIGANGTIYSLFLQATTGQLMAGGHFTQFEGQIRTNAVRINADGTLDGSFSAGATSLNGTNGLIFSLSMHTNGPNLGKVVIGGQFDAINGVGRAHLARLNADGSLDTGFAATGTDNAVDAVIVQNNGRILVAGQFTTINGARRNFITRLEESGLLDASFNIGAGPNGRVRALALDASGRILIAGDFTVFDGVAVSRVARLNQDGSLDKTFDTTVGVDAPVRAVALQSDGKVLIGGEFATFGGSTALNGIGRLNSDGTLDTGFMASITGSRGANDFVDALAVQPDGLILAGGAFTTFHGLTNHNRLVRLTSDGRLDPTFNTGTGFNDFVSSIVIQPDQKIVVAGGFTIYNGATHNRIARLVGGGNVGVGNLEFAGTTFTVDENGASALIQVRRTRGATNTVSVNFATSDGTAMAGVHYTPANGAVVFGEGETLKSFVVPILDNTNVFGSLTVNLTLFGATNVTTGLRDDALLGATTNAVLTILEDDGVIGLVSPTFSVTENGGIATITLRRAGGTSRQVSVDFVTSDGTALAGADYTAVSNRLTFVAGQTVASVAVPILDDSLSEGAETVNLTLINPTNVFLGQSTATLTIVDDELAPGVVAFATNSYTVVEGQPNASITLIRTNGSSGTVSVNYLATAGTATPGSDFLVASNVLTFANGEVSKSFLVPILDDSIEDDNETVNLTIYNPAGGATIFDADLFGTRDTNFNLGTGPENTVLTMALQTNGAIVVGGSFLSVDGLSRSRIARLGVNGSLDATFDPVTGVNGDVHAIAIHSSGAEAGRIVIGGTFTSFGGTPAVRITRLLANGTLDTGFATGNGLNGTVRAIAIYPAASSSHAGKIVVGGDFSTFNGISRNRIVRLNSNGSLDTTFAVGAGFNGTVNSLAIDTDDSIIAGGTFTQYGATPNVIRLARLNADGTLNTAFNVGQGPDNTVNSVLIAPNGQVLIAGDFAAYDTNVAARVARLQANGTFDVTFNPGFGPDAAVNSVALQPDGKVVIGGAFTFVNGFSRSRVARLLSDGSLDTRFDPGTGTDADVHSVLVQSDGKVVIGGAFTMYNGFAISRVARLQVLGLATALLTIVDNDVTLGFATNAFTFPETSGVQTITVTRSGLPSQTIAVDFFAEDGTAFAGLDYAPLFGSLVFGPNETNKTFNLTILDDVVIEGDEVFTLRLTNTAGANLVGFTSASATISDNDTNYDLTVSARVVEPVYTSSTFVYALTVTNRGPSTITGVTLTNALPAPVTFLGQSNTLGVAHAQSGNVISFDLGTIAAGTIATFYLTNAAPSSSQFVTNVASALPLSSGAAADRDTSNNVSTNVLFIRNASPFIANDAARSRLTAESVSPANGAVDPGEQVTFALVLQNTGNQNTAGSIVATLQNTNNIVPASGPASYGPLAVGQRATNSFTFTASGTNGQTLTAVFYLTDNGVFLSNNIVLVNFTLGSGTNFTNNVAITLPDKGQANPYPSTITVSNLVGSISRVTVTLSNVFHTYPADLDILLVGPTGEKVMLMSDAGAAQGVGQGAITNVTLTFDDGAATIIPQSSKLTNGTYRPADYDNPFNAEPDVFDPPAPAEPYQTSLQAFNGLDPNGVWSLYVVDDATQNSGGIAGGWSLNITAVTPVSPTTALALSMTPSTNTTFVGSNVVFTLVVTNLGPDTATGVTITNPLPASVTFVSATNASGSFTPVGNTVLFTVGTLVPGAFSTNHLEVVPRAGGTLVNSATVGSAEIDPYPPNNTASASVAVTAHADLVLSQNMAPTAALGGSLTNIITVSNAGPSSATNVVLTSTVPASVTVTSRTTTQGSVSQAGSIITANLGALASNATVVVTVVMRADAVGNATVTSSTASSVIDLDTTNNTASSTATITPSANLAIGMTASPNPVVVNSNLTYTITVTNLGLSASTNVVVTDVLPGSLTFVSAAVSQGSVVNTGGTISWSAGNLGAGSVATMTLTVSPTITGTVNNTATVTASTADPNSANNSVTVPVAVGDRSAEIVVAGSSLVSETGGTRNGQIDPGENVTVALALRNKGGSNTVNLVATLQAGGGVSFSGAQSASYGALVAGGSAGTNNFTFTATGTNGGTVFVSLALEDRGPSATNNLGTVTFPFTMGAINTFSNSAQIVINDNAPASPYPSTNTVSGLSGAIVGLTVTLHGLNHSYPDDINILLVSPSGRAAMLMSDAGGAFGTTNAVTLTFDDAAAIALPDEGFRITNGTYRAVNYFEAANNPASTNDAFAAPPAGLTIPSAPYSTNLSVFNGSNPNGDWLLYIMDDFGGDSGVILNGWSLRLTSVTTVNPSVDLALALNGAPEPAHVGSNLTYTVVVTNNGPNVATNVVVSNFLPSSVTFVSASNTYGAGTNTAGVVTLGAPVLDIGARLTNTIVVTPTAIGSITLTTTVVSAQAELVAANNTAALTGTVFNLPVDLSLLVTASTNAATVGSNLTYTIVVTNLGPNTATGARITNWLDVNETFVSATLSSGATLTASGQQVIFSLAALPGGNWATNVLVVRENRVGSVTNVTRVGIATQTETNLANNAVTIITTVEGVQFNASSSTVSNGNFSLSLVGRANKTYVVEASTDLVNWTPIYTNTSLSGAFSFIDTNAPLFPSRFYRAVER